LDGDIHIHYCHAETVQHVLGRTSAGTARVWEAGDGVHGSCDVANTPIGDTVLEGLRRGDLSGSSAGFWLVEASYEQRADGVYRWVEKAIMNDMSVEPYQAYRGATASIASQAAVSAPRSEIDNRIALLKRRLQTAPPWQQGELRSQMIALYRQQVH
jgi:HK97 family phage prohead protease